MAGFKTSFLGFNKDDVMNYIKATKEANNQKINTLNKQIEELNTQNQTLKAKVDEFDSKREEIERLSQSIAKMHIIACANAKTIMEKTAENMSVSQQQVDANVKCANDASLALSDIRSKLTDCYSEFCEKVDTLSISLDEMKLNIDQNNQINQEKLTSLIETFNKVDNT